MIRCRYKKTFTIKKGANLMETIIQEIAKKIINETTPNMEIM